MKTHEHAFISLGYAASVAFLAGGALDDPWLYVAAVAGGEILDFVDHPLYHLVYNRSNPYVAKARQEFKQHGWRAAVKYLNQVEDKRLFQGLWLHNVYALTLVALMGILISLFLPGSHYIFVFWGAMFLHMLTDVYGDFKTLGHIDNWLWVLPKRVLKFFGALGLQLVYWVMLWGASIQVAFFTVSFRWAWQLVNSSVSVGLYQQAAQINYAILPLVALSAYYLSLITLCAGQVHKYRLEIEGSKQPGLVPFSMGSVSLLGRLILHKLPWNRQNLEKILLRMQIDQTIWITILSLLIVSILMGLTWFMGPIKPWDTAPQIVFYLTPVFLALLFGTFVHTSIGEFGGVLGVLLAWLLNFLLARLNLQTAWESTQGYWLFGAAIGAWVLGLLGGMVLKGQSRLSLVVFSMQIQRQKGGARDDDTWLHDTLALTKRGLEKGYTAAHQKFFGPAPEGGFVVHAPADMMLTPYQGRPILGEDHHHLRADDTFVPFLHELAYILCDNKLTSQSRSLGEYGLLPVMPRYRCVSTNWKKADMYYKDGAYHWRSRRRPLVIRCAETNSPDDFTDARWILTKTWGEFIDHMLTRKSTIRTDVFIYPQVDRPDTITLCGITTEVTSTKEHVTVEAEAYARAVMDEMQREAGANQHIILAQNASARLFYPHVSFLDQELTEWADRVAVLPSETGSFPRHDLAFIQKSLAMLPIKNILNVTADFKKKIVILAVEYAIAFLIGLFNLNPTLKELISKLFE